MIIRHLAACILILSLTAAGCGKSASETFEASPKLPSKSAEPSANRADNGVGATPTGTPIDPTPAGSRIAPAAPPAPKDPPPTAEQIARWTPPSFEPLQLLAVRQWKKTSFTSRLAAALDGTHYLVAGSRVLLWSLTDDAPEHVFLDHTADDTDHGLKAMAVSPDGRWFAAGDSKGTLRIWSLEDRKELVSKQLYRNGIQHIAISPDVTEIATIAYDSDVTIWTADKLEQKRKFEVTSRGVERIEYVAPNLLAVAGESTAMWNTTTGDKAHDLPAGRYNFALARTPDGAKFVYGANEVLSIWDIAAAKPDAMIIRGVGGNVSLSVSSDGKTLATTDGRSVDLWSLLDGRRLQSMQGFGGTIVGVSWLPTTNLLAVASDSGITRIWGTPAQGESLGLKPLDTTVAMPDANSKDPATPEQLLQVINWRTFPSLPESVSNVQNPTDLSGVAPIAVPEARAFYRYFLTKGGWSESPPDPNNSSSVEFHKGGSTITAYFYDAGEGKTNFNLHHAGNFDVRWTPKADAAAIKIVHENAASSSYRAKAGILQLETSLLRKLHDAGWTAYARLNSSFHEEPNKRDFEFLRNGATLRISIGKFPDGTEETYTIQQSLVSNNSWAPPPPDAGFIEFDGSTEPMLIAITKMNLSAAREFYDSEMTSRGWLTQEIGRSLRDEQNWLRYLRGQCDLTVSLTDLTDGRVLVRIGNASGSIWEAARHKKDQPEEPAAAGLQAADFPLLNTTKTGKFDPLGKTIQVQLDGSTLANAAEVYTKALSELGWKAETDGIHDEEYTFFHFNKDDQEISFRARRQDGAAIVSCDGNGLLWTKELPGGKQVVSYEAWLRQSKLPPSLEFLERYETEMKAITGI
ncbi:MAG TPA: hypothetical protein VGN12_09545 [Pirellulales bacterium]|jgi:WD40 repeat protein